MATYAKEKGFTVQTLSTDPAASVAASGSWSSGGALNTGRLGIAGIGNTTPTAYAVGGETPSSKVAIV